MPIYEYRCRNCGKRFSVLTLRISERARPQCDTCGHKGGDRLMSRFAMPKSEAARMERLSDPSALAGIDETDPKSVGRWMRTMGKEMGDEIAGNDFEQIADEIETGGDDDSDVS